MPDPPDPRQRHRPDPDRPGWWGLLNGQGEISMQAIAWAAVFLFSLVFFIGTGI